MQEEIERFSLSMVQDPTAVINSDRGDVYNNIVLFTVLEDRHRQTPREMHIFQCLHKAVSFSCLISSSFLFFFFTLLRPKMLWTM